MQPTGPDIPRHLLGSEGQHVVPPGRHTHPLRGRRGPGKVFVEGSFSGQVHTYAINSVLMLQHFNLSHDELKSGT